MTADEIRARLKAAGWVRNDTVYGLERWYGPNDRTLAYIHGDGTASCSVYIHGGGTASCDGDLNAIAALLAPVPAVQAPVEAEFGYPENPGAANHVLERVPVEDTAPQSTAPVGRMIKFTLSGIEAGPSLLRHEQQPIPQPDTVAVPLPPDAPAELLEAAEHLDAAIGRCAEGAKALAGTRPGEELERKQAVYQWLRDIVAAALKGDGRGG